MESTCKDSFVTFAKKTKQMTAHLKQGHLVYLHKQAVHFNGIPINRTLYYAVTGLMDKADDRVL